MHRESIFPAGFVKAEESMTSSRFVHGLRLVRWLAVGLILLVSGWMAYQSFAGQDRAQKMQRAAIDGDFTLVDQNGKTVTWDMLRGRPALIYFGYAYCPDICPTALSVMGAAFEMLGKDADQIQPIFITIDPVRDTPAVLAQYVRSNGFPKNLMGLSGTPAQIEQAARNWTVIYRKSEEEREPDAYLMDHSSILYLMDADGYFVTGFTHTDTPNVLAECLKNHLAGKPCRR